MSLPAKPLRLGSVWRATDDGMTTIYQPDSDSLHALNDTALAIWELCDGETTVDEMALAIAKLTGLPIEAATRDVTTTVNALRDLGLVAREAG